ncbi:MAG: hypothetical protein F4121_01460 [Acidimicrobiia bacterium]|nr:hypothetical protein [Acidimicrobiia bacterium]
MAEVSAEAEVPGAGGASAGSVESEPHAAPSTTAAATTAAMRGLISGDRRRSGVTAVHPVIYVPHRRRVLSVVPGTAG